MTELSKGWVMNEIIGVGIPNATPVFRAKIPPMTAEQWVGFAQDCLDAGMIDKAEADHWVANAERWSREEEE